MVTEQNLETLQKVLKVLEKHFINHAILGGYPRDLAAGVQPKDIDICVWGHVSVKQFANFSKDLHWEGIEGIHFKGSAQADKNVDHVMKLDEHNIDIIFWNMDSMQEVLDGFDFNINQWGLLKGGEPVFLGEDEGVLWQVVGRGAYSSDAHFAERLVKAVKRANVAKWDLQKWETAL